MNEQILFYHFSSFTVLTALGVIMSQNPVGSGLSLVATFFSVSGVFVLLAAPFLGVIQVLVYAGAILVLFLYVMMLLNLSDDTSLLNSPNHLLKCLVGMGLMGVASFGLWQWLKTIEMNASTTDETFGGLFELSKSLLGENMISFELISLVLLASIVGVVTLTALDRHEEES